MNFSKNIVRSVLSIAVLPLFLLSLLLAPPASAAALDDDQQIEIDQAALSELQQFLLDEGYEGDISEEALKADFIKAFGDPSSGADQLEAFAENGCSTPKWSKIFTKGWDKVFDQACNAHDRCYSSDSKTSRKSCDEGFKRRMVNICTSKKVSNTAEKTCLSVAQGYYHSVRTFGKSYYKGKGSSA